MHKFLKFKACKGTIVHRNIQINNSPFLHLTNLKFVYFHQYKNALTSDSIIRGNQRYLPTVMKFLIVH